MNISRSPRSKGSEGGKELKCDENSGPVTELKVGTEDNQHIVAIEPVSYTHLTLPTNREV